MPKYKFSEIAFNITKKRKPTEEDMGMYIGLEHLDSGSLSVTRWGSKVPIKGDKLIMEKGDILFGKRNAYLKRAAIAPHDGLFSAHGMILRPNEKVISPKLFPFFICSDYFFDAAIRISVGSLSPTINWSALKELEFMLPDMEEQEKLAELLWAANNTKEIYKKLLLLTDDLVKAQFVKMFGDPVNNPLELPIKYLPDISSNLDNRRVPITSGNRQPGKYPYYGASGIVDYVKDYIFDEDVLLISEDGANLVARVTPIAFPVKGKCWINNHAHVVKFNECETQCYVEYLLNMIDLTEYITGTAQPKLSQRNMNRIPIPYPEVSKQKDFYLFVTQSDKSKFELQQNINNLEKTIKVLMAKNFG